MYNEKLKFQFGENVKDSEKLKYLSELFSALEAQSEQFEELVSGGVPTYVIKDSGKVVMHSFFPGSTEIINSFVKSKSLAKVIR